MTESWSETMIGEVENLKESKIDYLEKMLDGDYCQVFNTVKVHYNVDEEIIAKAVYAIENSDGAIEVLEMYIQDEYETIEECIVWAKRYD